MKQKSTPVYFFRMTLMFAVIAAFLSCQSRDVQASPKKGYLGVSIEEMTPSMSDEYEIGNRTGLLVTQVFHNSPADDAGLREDDVIVRFDGKSVEKADDFVVMVRNTAPRSEIKIKVVRRGKERELAVEMGRKRRNQMAFGSGGSFVSLINRAQLGVQIQDLDDDLGEYFPGADNEGVLVLKVNEDTPAEDAGLKAGDVIVKLDEDLVPDTEELMYLLAEYDDGDEVKVEYIRKGRKESVTIELENSHGMHWQHSNGNFNFFKKKERHRNRFHNELNDVIIHELHRDSDKSSI